MARRARRGKSRRAKRSSLGWLVETDLRPETVRGIATVVVFGGGGLSGLALGGVAGSVGDVLASALHWMFGWAAWPFVLLLFLAGIQLIRLEKEGSGRLPVAPFAGAAVFLVALAGLFHLTQPRSEALEVVTLFQGGGFIGFLASYYLASIATPLAASLILIVLLVAALMAMLSTSLGETVNKTQDVFAFFGKGLERVRGMRAASAEKEAANRPIRVHGMQTESDDDTEKEGVSRGANAAESGFREHPVAGAASTATGAGAAATSAGDAAQTARPDPDWEPFPLKLLEKDSGKPQTGDLEASAKKIRDTLASFGIEVEMEEVNVGPTVTQFTMRPAEGVRLNQITTLQSDLSLALAAHPLRIEAPIPGRSLVGIEVPNKSVTIVRLRGTLEAPEFKQRQSNLSLPLGRSVSGAPFFANLAKMPHLLIAGATGSGKSVCINTILISLLYQNSPQQLRLILVDPKKVELTNYNGIPHLLTPVVTEVDKTVNALKWAVSEMDRRFRLLAERGKRDIESFNQISDDKLPYLVIVIDELADLMAVAANEVEAAIVRLAQMARAVGIHLVLATQRPSVNVITGLIKANITSRVAFAVASQIDSRTIIDSAGAEKLLGNGDMLFVTSELSQPRRLQGAFVDEHEISRVKQFVEQAGTPDYQEAITSPKSGGSSHGGSGDNGEIDDAIYEEARALVVETGKASASYLQRRLRVGYARAARLLDLMEEQGVVGPADGAKPRDVFVEPEGGREVHSHSDAPLP